MKTLSIVLAACLFFLSGNLNAQNTNKSETIKVWGNCGMCKKTIEQAAKDAGATSAAWDKNTKMLAVKYNADQTSAMKIQETRYKYLHLKQRCLFYFLRKFSDCL